jgi:hypothetical protein
VDWVDLDVMGVDGLLVKFDRRSDKSMPTESESVTLRPRLISMRSGWSGF